MPYRVTVTFDRAGVDWDCMCPVGEDGEFCKHGVAVLLAVAAGTTARSAPAPSTKPSGPTAEVDVEAFVRSLGASDLANVVIDQMSADAGLHDRLAARAAAASGTGLDETAWRRRLSAAFSADGDYVDYRWAAGWAHGVRSTLDVLEELSDGVHADSVVRLAEHAHALAEQAVDEVDDSDGWLTEISERISAIHLAACEAARPDPVDLAARLATLELTSELGTFHQAAGTYANVLGPTGLAAYRAAVEPGWNALGPRKGGFSTASFHLHAAMIGIARATGDVDELIRVKERDLAGPDDYMEIAEALKNADRLDEAIAWARRGIDGLAERPWQAPNLREVLADLLRSTGDDIGAVEVFWNGFAAAPTLDTYCRLLGEAERTGDADVRRRNAHDFLASGLEALNMPSRLRDTAAFNSALIAIRLFEGDIDGAWITAETHGCNARTWMTLARAREADHPLDAIPVYQRAALEGINAKNNSGYRSAVDLLARIRTCALKAGTPELFDTLLAEIRRNHKPKRNLMALLNAKRW